MKAKYLGLDIQSPIIVSSSPYTASADNIVRCAASGAGAVVLKSIFEEQIVHQADSMAKAYESPFGDTDEYLRRYLGDDYKAQFLNLIGDAKSRCDIPVIASINCIGTEGEWVEYASSMAAAGADALELNVFILAANRHATAAELEASYANIVKRVTAAVKIPVSVKLTMRLTNVVATADALAAAGAKGIVLFNRFFEPDVDIEKMAFIESSPYSRPEEIRNVLRTTAICSAALPQLDIAVSTGVHSGEDAVKAILCGADAVQVCTAIHLKGHEVIGQMNETIDKWALRHGFNTIDEWRGKLDMRNWDSPLAERVQYMKFFPHE